MATPLDILTLLGKYGYGTVAQTELDPDLLCYLQMCPSWNSLAMEHLQQRTKVSGCLTAEEAALCLKTEIPGIVDEENPPKCRSLNSDKDLQPILWALGRFRESASQKVATMAATAWRQNAQCCDQGQHAT